MSLNKINNKLIVSHVIVRCYNVVFIWVLNFFIQIRKTISDSARNKCQEVAQFIFLGIFYINHKYN